MKKYDYLIVGAGFLDQYLLMRQIKEVKNV